MTGAILLIVVLVVVMPVGVVMSGAAGAGLLGWLLGRDRDLDNVDDDGQPNEHLRLADSDPWSRRHKSGAGAQTPQRLRPKE